MKIGQTSAVLFITKFVSSLIGFLATIYFARKLGAEIIGIFSLITTTVGWITLIASLGFGGALIKRLSEGEDKEQFLSATTITMFVLLSVMSLLVFLFQESVENYISGYNQYMDISVVWFIISFMFFRQSFKIITLTLKGEQKVHYSGILSLIERLTKRLSQLLLVFIGLELLGILAGYLIGSIISIIIGVYWVTTQFGLPSKNHFRSLYDYAKFSWFGGLKTRAFNQADILILGMFVSSSLVGVYTVSWGISKFMDIFSSAVKSTVFPEISNKSAVESKQATAGIIEKTIGYTGLIAIPGLVGGTILSERLLLIYGQEFVRGEVVLGILLLAIMIQSYQKQFLNSLNSLDRPDISFKINIVSISINIGLNLVLIWLFGVEGAAVATAVSAGFGLILSGYALSQIVSIQIPYKEISFQWIASLIMGISLLLIIQVITRTNIISNNVLIVCATVFCGSIIYFMTLISISNGFRNIVNQNTPSIFR